MTQRQGRREGGAKNGKPLREPQLSTYHEEANSAADDGVQKAATDCNENDDELGDLTASKILEHNRKKKKSGGFQSMGLGPEGKICTHL